MTDLDLDALAAVAETATPGEMYAGSAVAIHFRNTFDPATARALIAEAREAQRLRGEVAALADEWENGPAVGYDRNEQVELDTEKAHARTLRALIGGGQ